MFLAALAVAGLVGGCDDQNAATAGRTVAVRTATVAYTDYTQTIEMTGEIRARTESGLAFRVAGRIIERLVDVGDHVETGDVLARLNPQEQKADLDTARASVDAADAVLKQATSTLERQRALLDKGFTTRGQFDAAEEAYRVAEGSLRQAKAQLATARQNLADTDLKADAPGVITARLAEVGRVVQPGQTVFTLAVDGPRDAIFDVFESLIAEGISGDTIDVALVADPQVAASARLREISPTVDAHKGTVRVKFGIESPPPGLTLAASITGRARLKPKRIAFLAWSALASDAGKPAVWIVDPKTKTVSLRPIEIAFHERGKLAVSSGLEPGEIIVSAGGQLLRPGDAITMKSGEAS